MNVTNWSAHDVPWLNVHVFPSNTFRLEPWDNDRLKPLGSDRPDRLMAGQYAMYRFRILDTDGRFEEWAQRLIKNEREELSIRIFKNNSAEGPVLIDYELGSELYDRIKRYAAVVA